MAPGVLAALNRRRAQALLRELRTASRQTEAALWQTACRLSSGPVSQRTLSRPPPGLNHPYGLGGSNARGPRGPIPNGGDPGIVNRQTGNFLASWDTYSHVRPDMQMVVLYNDSPHARYMEISSRMVFRPIIARIEAIERGPFLARMAAARRRALRTP